MNRKQQSVDPVPYQNHQIATYLISPVHDDHGRPSQQPSTTHTPRRRQQQPRVSHTQPIMPIFPPRHRSYHIAKTALPDDKLNSQKQFASLIAGGIAGSFSATLTCPMEVVKTHLQASKGGSEVALSARGPFSVAKTIARVEGFRGFFRGLIPTLIGILPARATYFWAYATTKTNLSARFGESPLVHMFSAAAAGISSNTLTNPIWLIKSRVQLQAGASSNNPMLYRGYRDALVRIFREEGIAGFFKGLTASYWGVTEGALHFVVYERIKARLIDENRRRLQQQPLDQSDPERLTSIQYLTAAAISKLVASVSTYPHEVVRLRMREQPKFIGAIPKYRGMIQSLRLIAREEGRRGLYAGMGTHLARVVPNAALMFFTYETVVKWIEKRQADELNISETKPL